MTEVDLSMTESIFSRNTSILNDKAHIREILQSQVKILFNLKEFVYKANITYIKCE